MVVTSEALNGTKYRETPIETTIVPRVARSRFKKRKRVVVFRQVAPLCNKKLTEIINDRVEHETALKSATDYTD